MATPTPSVGIYIAECQRVLERLTKEGLKYEVRLTPRLVCPTGRLFPLMLVSFALSCSASRYQMQ